MRAGYCVATLAAEVKVCPKTLQRFAKECFDVDAHEWLNEMRMTRAVALLRQGTRIKEVAAQLGFSSSSSFDAAFRQWAGCSPRDYFQRNAACV